MLIIYIHEHLYVIHIITRNTWLVLLYIHNGQSYSINWQLRNSMVQINEIQSQVNCRNLSVEVRITVFYLSAKFFSFSICVFVYQCGFFCSYSVLYRYYLTIISYFIYLNRKCLHSIRTFLFHKYKIFLMFIRKCLYEYIMMF